MYLARLPSNASACAASHRRKPASRHQCFLRTIFPGAAGIARTTQALTLTEIANELQAETDRVNREFPTKKLSFATSLGAISKALSSLEEQLWTRRQNSAVVVPEPRRLLLEWATVGFESAGWCAPKTTTGF
jgi:hypothetical protein